MSREFKEAERKKFSERLRRAMTDAGFNGNSPTELQRLYNANQKGGEVTVHASRKWIMGEALPTLEKMRVLARMFGVSEEWLWFGDDKRIAPVGESITQYERRILMMFRGLDEADQELTRDFMKTLAERQKKKKALKGASKKIEKLAA